MPRIALTEDTFVLVLTGAGASAESGIPTFRDAANGLWKQHSLLAVASPGGFVKDPALVWRFHSQLRAIAAASRPNAGHRALVALEAHLGDRFLLATQNVDGLHGRAGSTRVVELHGSLFKTRCSQCVRPPFDDVDVYPDGFVPRCAVCNDAGRVGALRPHVVWFLENLDPADVERVRAFAERGARRRLVFLAVGTSGVVHPAAGMVDVVRALGAETWLINAEPAANTSRFEHFVQGPSGSVLPALFETGGATS